MKWGKYLWWLKIRDHHRCRYCGKPGIEADHVHPVSKGGREALRTNLVLCCRECNVRKNDTVGFSLEDEGRSLFYRGQLIAPGHLFGEELFEMMG